MTPLNPDDLRDAWRNLLSTGTPPAADLAARVLPEWSVGIDDWMDRLVQNYLEDYCLRHSHFKLVMADYGGGKSHFLLAFRARALKKGFATCYLRAEKKSGVTLDDWFSLYGLIAQAVRLPQSETLGIRAVVDSAYEKLHARAKQVPDVDFAMDQLLEKLEWEDYPSGAFAKVMAEALRQTHRRQDPQRLRAAVTWLQNGQVAATDLRALGVARIPQKQMHRHGLEMFYSLVKFLKDYVGLPGLVLLLDETDMMFNTRGRALERLMGATRTLIDQADDRFRNVPIFGLLAAVPPLEEQMKSYRALFQRFQVVVPFHEGCNDAPQIDLKHLAPQRTLLRQIGEKLLHLAEMVLGRGFDRTMQQQNLDELVSVADRRSADIDSRRLFVKTWCALLDEQGRRGEQIYPENALSAALQGTYETLRENAARDDSEDLG